MVDEGNRLIRFEYEGIFEEILDKLGQMPLPPYIHHQLKDKNRYQTVYAKHDGSAASTDSRTAFYTRTVGRNQKERRSHCTCDFTCRTWNLSSGQGRRCDRSSHALGVLHCGAGAGGADQPCEKKEGGKIVAVGTTSRRTLESATDENGILKAGSGWTDIFIYPGYPFKMIDRLITNFHLPESTLMMLVSALAGKDKIMVAYEEAVKERYRFFSFGDAMLIV